MSTPALNITTAGINLALNTIQRKQEEEIKKAVASLPETMPVIESKTPTTTVKVVVPIQPSSSLPKG